MRWRRTRQTSRGLLTSTWRPGYRPKPPESPWTTRRSPATVKLSAALLPVSSRGSVMRGWVDVFRLYAEFLCVLVIYSRTEQVLSPIAPISPSLLRFFTSFHLIVSSSTDAMRREGNGNFLLFIQFYTLCLLPSVWFVFVFLSVVENRLFFCSHLCLCSRWENRNQTSE